MTGRLDRQAAFTGTRDVPAALAFDAGRLETYLADAIAGFSGPMQISQFKGGQSNPTYRIEAASGAYVLRRKPPGALLASAHGIEREFKVMKALGAAGFPVPAVRLLCEDAGVIGTPFYVMDLIEGRIFWEPAMPGAAPAERRAVYGAMAATLADLHRLDPAALGLADFGRGDNYLGRQVARWSAQYQASATRVIPAMDRLIAWLPAHLPSQSRSAIIHGDFRLDNLILAPDRPEIRAVLDWELSTLGDPVADFTYHLMQWRMPVSKAGGGTGSLVGLDLEALGIPSLEAQIAAYEARTGLDVAGSIDRYFAFNFFRLAAILQGIVGRARAGTAANARAEAMADEVEPLAERAWEFAQHA